MSVLRLSQIQAGLIFLQFVNAGLTTLPPAEHPPAWLSLILSAAIGAGQFYIHQTAGDTDPRPKQIPLPLEPPK